MSRRRAVLLSSLLGLFAAFAFAACGDAIVGHECAPGYTLCDGYCASLSDDERNCGGCGVVCASNERCDLGVCRAASDAGLDGSVGDGAIDGGDGAVGDGSTGDAGLDGGADGSTGDGGTGCACNVGEVCCGTACVDPLTSATDCGGCSMPCPMGQVCSNGSCMISCGMGLTLCGSQCFDLTTDPDHCGSCTNVCASGICTSSMCDAVPQGHVVLIGHDYQTTRALQNVFLGNAAFIPGSPSDVLVYVGTGTMAASNNVTGAISQVAAGRTFVRTDTSDPAQVPLLLANADVFIVLAQEGSTDAEIAGLGTSWSVALTTFVNTGGVVVVLDAGTANAGTQQLLVSAGLLTVSGRTDVSGQIVTVTNPGDVLAAGAGSNAYRASNNSVYYDSTSGSPVVQYCPTAGNCLGPVVVHRVTP